MVLKEEGVARAPPAGGPQGSLSTHTPHLARFPCSTAAGQKRKRARACTLRVRGVVSLGPAPPLPRPA